MVLSLAALVVLRLYNSSVGTRDRSKIHFATFRGLGWDSLASLLGHCSVGASWGAVAWAQDCRRRLDVDREVDRDAMVDEAVQTIFAESKKIRGREVDRVLAEAGVR